MINYGKLNEVRGKYSEDKNKKWEINNKGKKEKYKIVSKQKYFYI